MFIALTLLTVFLYVFIKFTIAKHRKMKYVRHLPSPFEYPIIGSSISFVGKSNQRTSTVNSMKLLRDVIKIIFFPRNFGWHVKNVCRIADAISTVVRSISCAICGQTWRLSNHFKCRDVLRQIVRLSISAKGCGSVHSSRWIENVAIEVLITREILFSCS